MKFTLSWLKQFLDTNANLSDICHQLTMIGLEVEEIIDHSEDLATFEVAEIISAERHPDADKLQVCQVKTSSGTNQIVCGAPNARAGIKVVLAKEGTVIPNGNFKIKKAKIRGVASNGMLCSADELGIGKDSDGIIELNDNAEVGESFINCQGLDDPVIHINITPNRADALGVYGIARDLAAAGLGTLKQLEIPKVQDNFKTNVSVNITDSSACSFFLAREIKNIGNKKSPEWLCNFLDNIGVGSISPVVDVTNYISYSFGQPMHAYDANKIGHDLVVTLLDKAQKFSALNEKEYELPESSLVIADNQQIHCLAGIIGGAESACDNNTDRIILEAACFNPDNIAITGRKLQIHTDSRYRFERNVDSNFTISAMEYATAMILEICGGEASDIVTKGDINSEKRQLEFSPEFLKAKAGLSIEIDEICSILEKLGFDCDKEKSNIKITIPSWRYDVSIKEDIVEEIVRIHGYDQIPEIPLPDSEINRIIPKDKRRVSEVKRILAARGYDEVVSWSFTDSKISEMFGDLHDNLFLQNPISADLDYMRSSILPNLCKMAQLNLNRDFNRLSIFEVGPVFEDPNSINSLIQASGIRYGSANAKNCFETERNNDIYDIKADIQEILALANIDINKCRIVEDAPKYYHPTRSASLYLGKNKLAMFGQINPAILKKMNINVDVCAFEINLYNLPAGKDKLGMRGEFSISNYQSVTRDFAFLINKDVRVGDIINNIASTDRKLIKNVSLFDVYEGKNIEDNKKSIAVSVEIQDSNKTLTDTEINNLSDKIVKEVTGKFSAILRDG